MGIQKKIQKTNQNAVWECLGKKTVWFRSLNVWVYSTRMICIDQNKTNCRNNSEQHDQS